MLLKRVWLQFKAYSSQLNLLEEVATEEESIIFCWIY